MVTTPNLGMTELSASQSQKHVTVNAALRRLDALQSLPVVSVIDRDLNTPPGSPADGDTYILASSPTGAWSGHAGDIAYYNSNTWQFFDAVEGWIAYLEDENLYVQYSGSAWVGFPNTAQSLSMLGINTTADSTNKLSVRSNAVLFTAVSAGDGGNDDTQVKLNKTAAGDTASFLYQTGFSGRAEFGTIGDDHFLLKVSADGSTWYDALKIQNSSGRVAFKSFDTGLSAAGTDQAGATVLTKQFNAVTTCAVGAGVKLPTLVQGDVIAVYNDTANPLYVYPVTSSSINALSTNAPYVVGPKDAEFFWADTSTHAQTLINPEQRNLFAPQTVTGMVVQDVSRNQYQRVTRFAFTNTVATITYDAAGGYGNIHLGSFPLCQVIRNGAVMVWSSLTGNAEISATTAFVMGLGTAQQTSANGGSIVSSGDNIVTADTVTFSGTTVSNEAQPGAAVSTSLNGYSATRNVYLNFAGVEHSATNNGTITLNGYIELHWSCIGQPL